MSLDAIERLYRRRAAVYSLGVDDYYNWRGDGVMCRRVSTSEWRRVRCLTVPRVCLLEHTETMTSLRPSSGRSNTVTITSTKKARREHMHASERSVRASWRHACIWQHDVYQSKTRCFGSIWFSDGTLCMSQYSETHQRSHDFTCKTKVADTEDAEQWTGVPQASIHHKQAVTTEWHHHYVSESTQMMFMLNTRKLVRNNTIRLSSNQGAIFIMPRRKSALCNDNWPNNDVLGFRTSRSFQIAKFTL